MSIQKTTGLLFLLYFSIVIVGCPQPRAKPDNAKPAEGSKNNNSTLPAFEEMIPPPGPSPSIGTLFPPFTCKTTSGEWFDLKNRLAPDKYLIIWFWATWNDPHGSDLTALSETYSRIKGERFELVVVSIDPSPHAKSIIENGGFTFPVIENEAIAASYGSGLGKATGNYLLGPDGILLLKDLRADEMENTISTLLHADSIYKPVEVNISIKEELARENLQEPTQAVPESIIFDVRVKNPIALESDSYEVKIYYRNLKPTGKKTYLLINPYDSKSGYITSDGKPVIFHIVAGSYTEITHKVSGSNPHFMLDVMIPHETYAIEFYGETWSFMLNRPVTGDRNKRDFAGLPYCTLEAVERQGGAIKPE